MGFFELSAEPIITKPTPKKQILTCKECGLYGGCRSPKLRYSGEGQKGILIIGEQPTRTEDEKGSYGHGASVAFLRERLNVLGVDFDKDCYYTTAINCVPSKTREPSSKEIAACRTRILKLVERLKPTSIILLGKSAYSSIIEPRLLGRITALTYPDFIGDSIPDQAYKAYVTVTWAPSYLLETKSYEDGGESKPLWKRDTAIYHMWMQHLETGCTLASAALLEGDYRNQCYTTTDVKVALAWIQQAMSWKYLAFDYETTGKKPHRQGHKIYSVSISDGLFSYAFPFFDDPAFRDAWKALMLSDVKKIGQNIQFEIMWTHTILGYYPLNWHWDTMLAQHVLHNRKPTGLKYQVYHTFGSTGYDDEMDHFLRPTKKEDDQYGDNAFNQIDKAPLDSLLLYNALDSLYTYLIFQNQLTLVDDVLCNGNDLLLESSQTLVQMQEAGFSIDLEQHAKANAELLEKLDQYDKLILSDPILTTWSGEAFNYKSSKQLSTLLYEHQKIKPFSFTLSGAPSVDEETLSQIDLPIVKNILARRKLDKMQGTYLSQYSIECVDGKVHPFFNIHGVDTYRSSCNSPNIQNQPKRLKEAKRMIRSFIRPSKGNKLVEYDYKSLEVCLNACYSKDPMLVHYITDPSSDMHRDSAADCFLMDSREVSKEIRNSVKGKFVFAEFYGSYYEQVAADLWEDAKAFHLLDHLHSKGIQCYADFKKHIEEAEKILWEKRFPVHNEWREKQWKFYQKHGYVELLTGFRCYGPMKRNNTFNSPVQGAGFHVLMQSLNWVSQKMKKLEKSKIIGEIHDSMVIDLDSSEEDLVDYWVWDYGTRQIRDKWPWIIVPLTIEKEESEVDGTWADMKEAGTLKGQEIW